MEVEVNRVNHALFAGGLQLGASVVQGLNPAQTAASTVVAVLASWGPDVDQLSPWRAIDKPLPDEKLGHGGPMKHRGISHWWFWPALAAYVAHGSDMGDAGWVIWALILGWGSHLLGDFIFGQGRDAGIPIMPWWMHVGLGFKSGGFVERVLVPPGAIAALWWTCGAPWPN
jgi:hypothetical protein